VERPGAKQRIAAIAFLPLLLAVTAVLVLALVRNLPSMAFGLPGLAIMVGASWWIITETGLRRILGGVGSAIGAGLIVAAFMVTYQRPEQFIVRLVIVIGVLTLAMMMARYSVTRTVPETAKRNPPHLSRGLNHPVLLCNPWSGGGKVESFGLVGLAKELGIETVMLEPGLDLEELALDAVDRGADCLGMAGGDGSQALVASIAIKHDLPFVCVSAGTRNHFALDLGLDRDDPRASVRAFRDMVDRRVDYATVNDRLFVNNVSLGIYATIVQSEDYRENKSEVSMAMAAELLGQQGEGFDLQYTTPDGEDIEDAFLIMVSNNPYVLGVKRDVAQRRQMDGGVLGVFAVSTRTAAQAAHLLTMSAIGLRKASPHWHEFTTDEFEVRSHVGAAFVGVDGEAFQSSTPMKFATHPRGLKMYVPEGNLEAAEKRRARDFRIRDVAAVAMGHASW
jgi:diacylglycerol kinase family enzyme